VGGKERRVERREGWKGGAGRKEERVERRGGWDKGNV